MTIQVAFHSHKPEQELTLSRLEELFDFQYLPHLEFDNWKVEQYVKKQCRRAHKQGKIGQRAIWLGKLHAHQLANPLTPPLVIRWIGGHIGYGLFTNRAIKKWEFIGEYTGILRRRRIFFANINDYCFMYPRVWLTLTPLTIDSAKHGNYTRFINHSDRPNSESISVLYNDAFHIIFRAIEEIPAGAQLTYDYGGIYWNRRKKRDESCIDGIKWANDGS